MARPKKFARPGVPVPARPPKDPKARGPGGSTSKSNSTDGPDRRKRGFQVGPAHAPRNAYLGKVKKIKDDLIVKAKLKKQYAKVLKETGGTSGRLKDRSGRSVPSSGGGEQEVGNADGADGEDGHADSGSEEDAPGQNARASSSRTQSNKGNKLDRRPSRDARPSKGELSSSKAKDDRRGSFSLKRKRSDAERGEHATKSPSRNAPDAEGSTSASTSTHPRKVRALSPSAISAPMPQTSMRDLKKEAFKKYHPARQHSSASLRAGGAAHTQTTTAGRRAVSASSAAASGPPGAGKARGQPNMAARMGVLLEKIRRDKA